VNSKFTPTWIHYTKNIFLTIGTIKCFKKKEKLFKELLYLFE